MGYPISRLPRHPNMIIEHLRTLSGGTFEATDPVA